MEDDPGSAARGRDGRASSGVETLSGIVDDTRSLASCPRRDAVIRSDNSNGRAGVAGYRDRTGGDFPAQHGPSLRIQYGRQAPFRNTERFHRYGDERLHEE